MRAHELSVGRSSLSGLDWMFSWACLAFPRLARRRRRRLFFSFSFLSFCTFDLVPFQRAMIPYDCFLHGKIVQDVMAMDDD